SRTATSIAVQLGKYYPAEVEALVKSFGSVYGILAGHAVYHKQDLLGADCIFNIRHLGHHLLVNRQAARGIDNNHVLVFAPGAGHGSLCNAYCIVVFWLYMHLNTNLLA